MDALDMARELADFQVSRMSLETLKAIAFTAYYRDYRDYSENELMAEAKKEGYMYSLEREIRDMQELELYDMSLYS